MTNKERRAYHVDGIAVTGFSSETFLAGRCPKGA
jgi:hypothetical protein